MPRLNKSLSMETILPLENITLPDGKLFLAHRIRTSESLSWDRTSYFTHVIIPRLSCEGCTLVVSVVLVFGT